MGELPAHPPGYAEPADAGVYDPDGTILIGHSITCIFLIVVWCTQYHTQLPMRKQGKSSPNLPGFYAAFSWADTTSTRLTSPVSISSR